MRKNRIQFFLLIVLFLFGNLVLMFTVQADDFQILQRIKIPEGYRTGAYAPNKVLLSPDGKKVIYITHNFENKTHNNILIFSEFKSPTDMNTQVLKDLYSVSEPVFSPDSKKIAFIIQSSKTSEHILACDGDIPLVTAPDIMRPVFSEDSRHLACIACTKIDNIDAKDKKYFVMLDGKKCSPDFDYMERDILWVQRKALVFNKDGDKLAYLVGEDCDKSAIKCKKYFLMTNEQKIGPNIDKSAQFFFSADNQLIYAAKNDKGNYNIYSGTTKISPDLNELLDPSTSLVDNAKLVLSPDKNKVAYKAKIDGKWWVMINEQKITEFKWVKKIIFSPDSSKIAYAAANSRGKWHIMLNDRQISPDYKSVSLPVFSPDGSKIAYSALTKDYYYVIMINDKQISMVNPSALKLNESDIRIDVLGFCPNADKVLYEVAYIFDKSEFALGSTIGDSYYSYLVLNNRQITPYDSNFLVCDYKIADEGIYFAGFFLNPPGIFSRPEKNTLYVYPNSKAPQYFSNQGELIHGFVKYQTDED